MLGVLCSLSVPRAPSTCSSSTNQWTHRLALCNDGCQYGGKVCMNCVSQVRRSACCADTCCFELLNEHFAALNVAMAKEGWGSARTVLVHAWSKSTRNCVVIQRHLIVTRAHTHTHTISSSSRSFVAARSLKILARRNKSFAHPVGTQVLYRVDQNERTAFCPYRSFTFFNLLSTPSRFINCEFLKSCVAFSIRTNSRWR
jgi:hypothetical protein